MQKQLASYMFGGNWRQRVEAPLQNSKLHSCKGGISTGTGSDRMSFEGACSKKASIGQQGGRNCLFGNRVGGRSLLLAGIHCPLVSLPVSFEGIRDPVQNSDPATRPNLMLGLPMFSDPFVSIHWKSPVPSTQHFQACTALARCHTTQGPTPTFFSSRDSAPTHQPPEHTQANSVISLCH